MDRLSWAMDVSGSRLRRRQAESSTCHKDADTRRELMLDRKKDEGQQTHFHRLHSQVKLSN